MRERVSHGQSQVDGRETTASHATLPQIFFSTHDILSWLSLTRDDTITNKAFGHRLCIVSQRSPSGEIWAWRASVAGARPVTGGLAREDGTYVRIWRARDVEAVMEVFCVDQGG